MLERDRLRFPFPLFIQDYSEQAYDSLDDRQVSLTASDDNLFNLQLNCNEGSFVH